MQAFHVMVTWSVPSLIVFHFPGDGGREKRSEGKEVQGEMLIEHPLGAKPVLCTAF